MSVSKKSPHMAFSHSSFIPFTTQKIWLDSVFDSASKFTMVETGNAAGQMVRSLEKSGPDKNRPQKIGTRSRRTRSWVVDEGHTTHARFVTQMGWNDWHGEDKHDLGRTWIFLGREHVRLDIFRSWCPIRENRIASWWTKMVLSDVIEYTVIRDC